MTMRTWIGATVLALSLLATGCGKTDAPATGASGKAEEAYAKKLVGVWEGSEDMKDGGKPETVTVEFKADGNFKMAMGPIELPGTWKLAKEEGTTLTIDTEVTFPGFGKEPGKADKKTVTVKFEDANTIVMAWTGDKPDPKKLKRKA